MHLNSFTIFAVFVAISLVPQALTIPVNLTADTDVIIRCYTVDRHTHKYAISHDSCIAAVDKFNAEKPLFAYTLTHSPTRDPAMITCPYQTAIRGCGIRLDYSRIESPPIRFEITWQMESAARQVIDQCHGHAGGSAILHDGVYPPIGRTKIDVVAYGPNLSGPRLLRGEEVDTLKLTQMNAALDDLESSDFTTQGPPLEEVDGEAGDEMSVAVAASKSVSRRWRS